MNCRQPLISAAMMIALLSGCGGGGGSGGENDIPETPPASTDIQILQSGQITSSGSIALYLDGVDPQSATWRQLSGPPLEVIDESQGLLGLSLASSAGDYSFEITYQKNGEASSETISFSSEVGNLDLPFVVRQDRTVIEGTEFSLRAELSDGTQLEEVNWQQTDGPTVLLDADNELLFVTAPSIAEPVILAFEATAELQGQMVSDTAWVQVLPAESIPDNAYFDDPVADVTPFTESAYSASLSRCAYNNQLTSSCLLEQLPLLAEDAMRQGASAPTTDQIMDRVLVSHQWMGEAFKDFLNAQQHDDFHQLLSAVTAVVISYDIRPSFYWAATGAIYLDAENLWRTAQQRDFINQQPDYRSGFGQTLQFDMLWRYTKDNQYAYRSIPRTNRDSRAIEDLSYRFSALLYHELAHANDFFPPSEHANLSPQDSALSATLKLTWLSETLKQTDPLQSEEMEELAQVAFRGAEATPEQEALLPDDIAQLFPPDKAIDFYSYSTEREDFAMLFEELMLQYRLGLFRDVSVTNNPGTDAVAEDYVVTWGQRGRVAEPWITSRAFWVQSNILPSLGQQEIADSLSTPIPMRAGDNWVENLELTPSPLRLNSLDASANKNLPIERLRLHGKPLPQQ
ncbi:hypothetical protein ACFSJ3_18790 [Corallincola platygyrae]|uniref:Lipoprotein n=1 Tax=Corallincola platygyrae TaxID=1193278 RepID=A0ABW4XSE5_9GAMM